VKKDVGADIYNRMPYMAMMAVLQKNVANLNGSAEINQNLLEVVLTIHVEGAGR